MNGRRWKVLLAAGLALASALLYVAFFSVHPDWLVIEDWFLGSLAFVPFQILIVTLVVDGLLGRREQQARLKKLNIVIGVFFSEIGMELLGGCLALERRAEALVAELRKASRWSPGELAAASARYRAFAPSAAPSVAGLERVQRLLAARRPTLTALMTNPSVLEHEHFTDLLIATLHLKEELQHRQSLSHLPDSDLEHLAGDVRRAYQLATSQWLHYTQHLLTHYPFLYSLAVRTNPFVPGASPLVQSS